MKTMETSGDTVAFILKGYPRLSETFILNEILLLEKLGFKLHIFAMRNPNESKVHKTVSQIQAKVTYIPDYFWPHFSEFISSCIRQFLKRPAAFWPAFKFAVLRSLRLKDFATIKRFSQAAYFVDRCLPDTGIRFFYSHFSHDPTTMTYFASRLTGIKFGISAHAKDIYLEELAFLKQKITRSQFITTCTGFNTDFLKKIANGETSVLKCYHGINTKIYALRQTQPQNERPQILSIGRLVPKKGFPTMLTALKNLREKGQDFQCNIIGSGPLKSALLSQIEESGLTGYVHLHSEMSQQELSQFYQKADIFALACEVQEDGDRDGIPNVIVESMATGIPIVAIRISGIPECVENGVSGILVEQRNPAAFADALAALLSDVDLRQKYGLAGRKQIEKTFDSAKNISAISAALQKAMQAKTPLTSAASGADKLIPEVAVSR